MRGTLFTDFIWLTITFPVVIVSCTEIKRIYTNVRMLFNTFFWSGRNAKERRESGLGFAVKNCLVSKLASLLNGVNDKLMTLRLHLANKRHATSISACAPTMTNPEEVKEIFYEDLDKLITSVPRQYTICSS